MTDTPAIVQQLAGSVWFTVISRGAMLVSALFLSIFAWVAISYIDGQQHTNEQFSTDIASLSTDLGKLTGRVIVLETSGPSEKANREDFQGQVLARMDRIEDRVTGMATGLAGLTARVETLIEQKRADASPFNR